MPAYCGGGSLGETLRFRRKGRLNDRACFGLACGSESGVASVTGVRGEERAEEGSPCMGLKAQPQPRTQRGKE